VKLGPNQWKAIFDDMSLKSKLKSLNLESLNLEAVDMKVFDNVFSNLTTLILRGLDLDNNQLKHFAENLDQSCKLKTLMLRNIKAKELTPRLLERVVTKVSSVDLDFVEMTVDRLEQIFHIISTGSSSIKQMNLFGIADIHEINPCQGN
jgi:hypothetical protein